MSPEETQPHIPMSPEDSHIPPTANSADRTTRRELPPHMRLEQDLESKFAGLSPDIQLHVDAIVQARDNNHLGARVWTESMEGVYGLMQNAVNRTRSADDYEFAGNLILRACEERVNYLQQTQQVLPDHEQDAMWEWGQVAKDYLDRARSQNIAPPRERGRNDGNTWGNWLFEGDVLNDVRSSNLRSELAILSRRSNNMADPESLRKAYLKIEDLLRGGLVTDTEANIFLDRISARLQSIDNFRSGEFTASEDLRRIREAAENQEIRQIGNYAELVRRIEDHLSSNLSPIKTEPDSFFEDPPEWYNRLSTPDRELVKFYFTLNYVAGNKLRSTGENALDNCINPENFLLDRKALDRLWMEMPGFRQATTTMIRELFVFDEGRLYLSNTGKDMLENGRDAYLNNLESRLRIFLSSHPEIVNSTSIFLPVDSRTSAQERIDLLCAQAIQTSWSLFYMSGAIESGNRDFRLKSGPDLQQISLLQLYHPRDWLSFRLREDNPRKFSMSWGGIGKWYRFERRAGNKDGLRHQYLPSTLAMSWFDYVTYKRGRFSDRTLAETLYDGSVELRESPGLYDLVDVDSRIANLESDTQSDLWFNYSTKTGSARKIFELLTGATELEKRDATKIVEAWKTIWEDSRFMSDSYIKKLMTNDDFILAQIVMLAGDPLIGSPRLIPNIQPDNIYSAKLFTITSEFGEIFQNMKGNARMRILNRLYAIDMNYTGINPLRHVVDGLKNRSLRDLKKKAVKRYGRLAK